MQVGKRWVDTSMYFLASKIIGFILLPSNAVGLLCGLGLLLLVLQQRRAAGSFLVAGAALLVICGFSPIGNVLLLSLTERFPLWQAAAGAPDGVIVLGGSIEPETTAARRSLEVDGSAERLFAMLELARRYPRAKIVFSGGSGNLIGNRVGEAPIAGDLLEQYGLANDRVVLENKSRSTEENAEFTRRLVPSVAGQRWLLVTSAFHMPRAVGLFRGAGFDVEAYPVDFRTRGWASATAPSRNVALNLMRTDTAVHEWIGLLAAWLKGSSRELFPGPRS